MRIYILSYLSLVFLFLILPQLATSQSCCPGGIGFETIISGSCPRILPNNSVRNYSIDRIRDSEGAVIELLNKDLLAVWSKFTDQGRDNSAGWLVGRKSSDRGISWGPEFVISGVWGMQNAFSPSLLRLPNNELLLFVLAKHDEYEEDIILMRSNDDGETWSCPQEINLGLQQAYHVMVNDKVIQLTHPNYRGRIVCPVSFSSNVSRSSSSISAYFKSVIFYSDDEGETWEKGQEVTAPSGYVRGVMEPVVVELNNGELMMLMRTRNNHFLKVYSSNGGSTWSEPVVMREDQEGQVINAPESPISLKRIPCTGDLLMIYNNGQISPQGKPRKQLDYRLSSDEGQTWSVAQVLDGGPSSELQFAYTSITFMEEQALITYYEHTPALLTDVGIQTFSQKFRSIPIGWFYGATPLLIGEPIKDCWQNTPISLDASPPVNGTGAWQVISGSNYALSDSLDPKAKFIGENQRYTLVWQARTQGDCRFSDTLEVDLTDCGAVSNRGGLTNGNQVKKSFLIFSSASTDELIIRSLKPNIFPTQVTLTTLDGKVIWDQQFFEGERILKIKTSSLHPETGMLLVGIRSNKSSQVIQQKVVIH